MSITAKELAERLGISPSAVSIALNGKKGISDEKRDFILRAAKEYGLKRPLRKSFSSTFINLVIFKKHGMVYGDTPFFAAVTEGISAEVANSGYNLQISYFYGNQDNAEQLKSLSMSDCAGIILLATEMEQEDIQQFLTIDKPLVVLDCYFEGTLLDCVVINNSLGAYLATKHLIEFGHTDLGYIHSNVHINNFVERYDGFTKAIADSAIANRCSVTHIHVGSTQDSAYNDMIRYLRSADRVPSALFADNDIIAISCMRALKEHGYRIPEDVSIVGFDDMPMSYVTSPKLTTIHVPKELLGGSAVSLLLKQIESSDSQPAPVCMRIGTTLVLRDTVYDLRK